MKRLFFALAFVMSCNVFAWQTWIYNDSGHDIFVKLFGIGSIAGFGDFEVLVPKNFGDKFVIDTGIYGISHGNISVAPAKSMDKSCLEEGHDEYCDAVLKFLAIDFNNPCYNQLPGMSIRITLVKAKLALMHGLKDT